MMEKGFYHPTRGYWQVIGEPSQSTIDAYPSGSIEVPLKPGQAYEWRNGVWVYTEQDPTEVLAEWRENASCTRAQGKLAIGPVIWGQVVAMLDDPETPWGLRVAVEDTPVWNRNNEDMAALIWAMGLTPEQADDLFRLAATL
jgi:hypothetical protein